jgi:hypothetical protein
MEPAPWIGKSIAEQGDRPTSRSNGGWEPENSRKMTFAAQAGALSACGQV